MATAEETLSQKKKETDLNFSLTNASVVSVVETISKQTGYKFFFDEFYLSQLDNITVQLKNATLQQVLNQISKQTKLGFHKIDDTYTVTPPPESANPETKVQQGITITGTVVDETGNPLPGASVVIKGTTQGTVTDANGAYSLQVPDGNATLVFSFIGYVNQEMVVGNQRSINISLKEDVKVLEEVVVIGYGSMRKSDLTGSVVRADIDAFIESPNVSIIQSLQGSVAGFNVGQVRKAGEEPQMSVRGLNTMNGVKTPLIVMDGVIYRGDPIHINPNDVESIDILKDASAAAIYGSQSASGVLLITTKSGRDAKPVVNYNGSVTFQYQANKEMVPATRDQFTYMGEIFYVKESRQGPDYLQRNPNFNLADKLIDPKGRAGFTAGEETDWWDLMTRGHGTLQNHNLSLRGGNSATRYYMSLGYLDQKNIFENDMYKRYNLKLNLDTKVTDWLKLGANTSMGIGEKPAFTDADRIINQTQRYVPFVNAYDANGDIIDLPYQTRVNPLHYKEIWYKDSKLNFNGIFFADIDVPFIDGLNYRINYGQNLRSVRQYYFDPYENDLEGRGYKYHEWYYDWNVDNIVTYKRQFGLHHVNATLVYGIEKHSEDKTQALVRRNFPNKSLGYNSLQTGQADQHAITTKAEAETFIYSMARIFYSFNNKYMFTGTIRRDGYSGFGVNNKVALFPTAGISWNAGNESFIRDNAIWIDQLKLRATYGISGNRSDKRYRSITQLQVNRQYLFGDGASSELAMYANSLGNGDLKWEKTAQMNLGFDFSIIKNRLSGSFDYYTGKTNDMLYSITIPYINGFNTVWSNMGELQNKGQELELTGIPLRTKDFRWSLSFVFSRNRNKVASILGKRPGEDVEKDIISNDKAASIFIGLPYGVYYDYNVIGMWQLSDVGNIPSGFDFGVYKVEDIDGNGSWTAANDRKIMAYKDPSYRFSIQNTFSYKGFELKIFLNSMQGGGKYFKRPAELGMANSGGDRLQDNVFMWDFWAPENPNAKYQRPGAWPSMLGDNVLPYVDRSFIRLQDVSLSYTFSSRTLDRIGLKMLKVYVSGKNLHTWTKFDGWDPEIDVHRGHSYPVMRDVSVGLNVEF